MSKQVDDNGYWLIEGNPISKEGVFPYLGKTISPRLQPDKIYQVYRPFAELSDPETLKSFDGIPFIEDHEMLGDGFTSTDKRTPQGVLMNTRAENGMIVGDLKIFSDSLKHRIESGKKELSLGYRCHYDLTPGEWNGQPYDAIQTELRGNHIALVGKGRMGSDVRVFDCWACDALEIAPKTTITKESYDMYNHEKKTPAKDESVDKRKQIDEIGGILKGKVDEETWRTIIGKVEKVAYNGSEASKADDEAEEEEGKKEDKPEAKATDKCSKDEDEEKKPAEEKKSEDEDEKKDEEKKSKDACGKDACGKDEFFDGPKMEKTVRELVSNKEISEEIAKKILGSERYTRGGMDEADYIGAFDRRNALYGKVSQIVGDFAMDGMTEADIAKFAGTKLGIPGTVEACEAYFAAWGKGSRCVEVAADSAPKTARRSGSIPEDIKNYLNKK